MGGQSATTQIITNNANPPSYHAQSNPDFLLVLTESLNIHLQYPIEYTGDTNHDIQNFLATLSSRTLKHFLDTFDYAFTIHGVQPKHLSKTRTPPITHSSLVSCPTSSPQRISAYILSQGFSLAGSSIPRAYARRVVSDLDIAVRKCLHVDAPPGSWRLGYFHRVYSEPLGILPNFAVDIAWLWCVVGTVDYRIGAPAKSADVMLMQYAGVAYATKEMRLSYE